MNAPITTALSIVIILMAQAEAAYAQHRQPHVGDVFYTWATGEGYAVTDEEILGEHARLQLSTDLIWSDTFWRDAPRVQSSAALTTATGAESVEEGSLERCRRAGGFLPTSREWATMAVSMGASMRPTAPELVDQDPETTREVRAEIRRNRHDGFTPIWKRGPAPDHVPVVNFYYRARGYEPENGVLPNLGGYTYWTSSVLPRTETNLVYVFDGTTGALTLENRIHGRRTRDAAPNHDTRCVF